MDNRVKQFFILGGMIAIALLHPAFAHAAQPPMTLHYDKPATEWMTSALPIGNGELGAMFFGGVQHERVQFNEKTLWTGSPSERGAYQNFGDLDLDFAGTDSCADYRRELCLDEAIGRVSYRSGGVKFTREYFVSYPDRAVVLRISAPGCEGRISFSAGLSDAHAGEKNVSDGRIVIRGKLDLLGYEAQVKVLNEGGTLRADSSHLVVSGADAVTILLTAATNYDLHAASYIGETPEQLHIGMTRRMEKVSGKSYDELKAAHLADYRPLFDRVKLDLGAEVPVWTTDLLVRAHRDHPYLDMLYFQYGRYLMLSSSRGMDLPSNLQGLWNDSNHPAWECDIHSNINVQMNYWPAENTALSACHMPFIDYVAAEALKPDGSWRTVAAKEGLRGWSIHTQSNIFGYTDWNINRPANAWYCMHLWQHYAYTCDVGYLRRVAFPVMESACEYWFDRLIRDAAGQYLAPDEWSPEQGPWEDGVTYAQQLIRELFDKTRQAVAIIGADPIFAAELEEKYSRLDPGLTIGDWGQIREWKATPDIRGNNHRHLSQLIALYPGDHISYHLDSLYADAAKKTLLSRGDNGTGWSRAWKISCWARLFDGDHAYKLLKQALNPTYVTTVTMEDRAGGVYENLLDAHPSFQIDGNFGATAGIAEMLLQSNLGFIQLLPALPSAWSDGQFKGLKAVGNFAVDLRWRNGRPVGGSIDSFSGKKCRIFDPQNRIRSIADAKGRNIAFEPAGDRCIVFRTRPGERYTLTF